MAETKKSAAVFHPRLGFGGSEAVAMWMLEALKRDYRIALVAGGAIDLPALNESYGTSIDPEECETVELPLPWPLARVDWGAAIRGALVGRSVRRHLDRFDVLISSYNLADFGRPAIHVMADFSWDDELRRRFHPTGNGLLGALHRRGLLRDTYLSLMQILSPSFGRNVFSGEDLIVANSNWTARILRERYDVPSAPVIYPPVGEPSVRHVPDTHNYDFACFGRISEEKRITTMTDILSRVRSRGFPVRLRIVGAVDDSAYSRKICALAEQNRDWVILAGGLWSDAKWKLLAECGYGIHGCRAEAFGIAVAEMVKAGCIAFAPTEGGPAEILGHPALLYGNVDEAVEKICAVLSRPALQASLREHLRGQADKFSIKSFMRHFRENVEAFVHQTDRHREAVRAPAAASV